MSFQIIRGFQFVHRSLSGAGWRMDNEHKAYCRQHTVCFGNCYYCNLYSTYLRKKEKRISVKKYNRVIIICVICWLVLGISMQIVSFSTLEAAMAFQDEDISGAKVVIILLMFLINLLMLRFTISKTIFST